MEGVGHPNKITSINYKRSRSNSDKEGHDGKTIMAIVATAAGAITVKMRMAMMAVAIMAKVATTALVIAAIVVIVATELTMAMTAHVIEYIVYKKMTSNTNSYSAVAISNFPNLSGYYIPTCLLLCASINITKSVSVENSIKE